MRSKGILRILLALAIVVTNIGCDQVSKRMIRDTVVTNENISLLGDRLTVTRVENSGAFLSLGDSLPKATRNILLAIIPLLVITAVLGYVLVKKAITGPLLLGLCCIIGGGIGNIFDRIVYGSVTDFLHIDLGIFRTGIFNMADLSVVTGTLIILFQALFKKKSLQAGLQ